MKKIFGLFFMIFVILLFVLWVNYLFNSTQKKVSYIWDYSNAIISWDEDITDFWVFHLKIWWEEIKWTSISYFSQKLNEVVDENLKMPIEIKVVDEKWVILKVHSNYTYKDFSYSLDIAKILERIKYSILDEKKDLSLNIKDYIYVDNKRLNELVWKIKNEYDERSIGNLYQDENWGVKVNNNKIYLTKVIDTRANIENVWNKLVLQWSQIVLVLERKENDLYKNAQEINKNADMLRNYSLTITSDQLLWMKTSYVLTQLKKIQSKYVEATFSEWKLSLNFKKGFLSDYIWFDEKTGELFFRDTAFFERYAFLKSFVLSDDSNSIVDMPSLYDVTVSWLDENYPKYSDFKILTSDISLHFDPTAFSKGLKVVFQKPAIIEEHLFSNILIVQKDSWQKELSLNVLDKEVYVKNQDSMSFKPWMYNSLSYLGQKDVDFWKYPFMVTNISSSTDCSVNSHILSCWDQKIGNLEYTDWKIVIKDVSNLFWVYQEDDSSITKLNGSFVLNSDTVSLTNGDVFYNFTLNNQLSKIIYNHKLSLPKILTSRTNIGVKSNKLTINLVSEANQYLIIKDFGNEYYFYLVELKINEI